MIVEEPKLYIVMRKDLQDMNPGKSIAQGAHAQADFLFNYREKSDLYYRWLEDRTFGTTIVLETMLESFPDIAENIFHSNIIVDPTYPWKNWYGNLFLTPEITCMWAFPVTKIEEEYMKQFSLHP